MVKVISLRHYKDPHLELQRLYCSSKQLLPFAIVDPLLYGSLTWNCKRLFYTSPVCPSARQSVNPLLLRGVIMGMYTRIIISLG